MPAKVLICDDSSFARKQIATALPEDWDVELAYAKHGAEAMQLIKEGGIQLLFLDLTMPVMDGYEVLEAVRDQKIPIMVIVVSGDIQPEAQKRVLSLGATEFIKKPVKADELSKILKEKNIRSRLSKSSGPQLKNELRDVYTEIANVAIGRAADLLAQVLGTFVRMPIPRVDMLEVSELQMALNQTNQESMSAAVCQGFIGSGIAGEALLIFDEASFWDLASLMKFSDGFDTSVEMELLMDLSSILIGACLKGLGEQLDLNFSQSHPRVLGHHINLDDLFNRSASRWRKMLAMDMEITIEGKELNCNLLLLFTENSIKKFNETVSYYMEA